MPTEEGVITSWIFLLLLLGLIVFIGTLVFAPKSRISRGVDAFWNTPSIVGFRKFFYKLFMFMFVSFITITAAAYYFTESSWYPREREVEVFFKAHQWIEGEIQSCHSVQTTTPKTPDAELTAISCSFEQSESHVLRAKFWGPVKADRNKVWKCERSQTSMTCRLQ